MTADWYGNRTRERYTFRRVTWNPGQPDHFQECSDYTNVTGGSVELSAFTDTKASCSFDFLGGELPDTRDLVRIYYSFTDDNGETAETAIGTFFVEYADTTYEAANGSLVASGTVDGSSVLSMLIARKLGVPYTVDSGTDCLEAAVGLVDGVGLPVSAPESNGYQTSTAHTFEPDDSYLTVVNWLLTTAGYQSAYPDAFGRVVIEKYVAPEKRDTVATFRDDSRSIMLPEVAQENDWAQTPNVARLSYSSDDESLYAIARCVSGSKSSLDARGGRELTLVESVTELDGATQQDRIDALEAMARQRLIDQSAEIERATLTHAYIDGIQQNDAIAIEYSGASWRGNVTNMEIALEASTPCTTKLRRFVDNALEIETEGGALWTA